MLFFFTLPTFSYNDLRCNRFSTGWEKEKETRTKHRMEGREKSGGTILWCIIGIRYILVVVMKEILMDTRRWRRWWGFYLPSRNVDVHECTCDRRCRGQNRWNPPWITNTVWKITFVTFYLVKSSRSMNVQQPLAIGADEANTGVIFYILSILYIIKALIAYILSNSGIKWWGSRWYSLLQWFSISRVRCLEFDLFGRYIRHNFS